MDLTTSVKYLKHVGGRLFTEAYFSKNVQYTPIVPYNGAFLASVRQRERGLWAGLFE